MIMLSHMGERLLLFRTLTIQFILLEVLPGGFFVLLIFVECHATKEGKNQVFIHHRCNGRWGKANTAVKDNERPLAKLFL